MTGQEPDIPDDEIIRLVREGYSRRYEILIERYRKRIINFIHKMIFDYDEAQSLTQDVFVKVYEAIPHYKMQDTFQAFIFTIAKNLTLNYIKKQKRLSWFSRALPDHPEEKYFSTPGTQYEEIERNQQESMITEGLKRLKENQRIAIILKVYLDFSYNKISEVTGWSIPKIETLISRAKSNLKENLHSQHRFLDPGKGETKTGYTIKNKKVQETPLTDVL